MLGFLEYAFMGPNIPFERFSLAQEGIFLAFEERDRYPGADPILEKVFLWSSTPSLCRAPDSAQLLNKVLVK